MAGMGPNVLVVDRDREERGAITALLRDAGFAVVPVAAERGALTALRRRRFAAAVVAPWAGDSIDWIACLRRPQLDMRALLVAGTAVPPRVNAACGSIVRRPFDPHQLLGCVFELVMRDPAPAVATPDTDVAELVIAAAMVACLCNRRAIASAAGANRLARELTRQIDEMRTNCGSVARAAAINGPAADLVSG